MNNRLQEQHVFIMYILAFAGMLMIILSDISGLWFNLLISLCWLFSFTIRNLLIYRIDKHQKMAGLTYIVEILLLFLLCIIGEGEATKLLFCITVADCFIVWGKVYGISISVIAFILYSTQFFQNNSINAKNILMVTTKESPAFIIGGLISYLVGKVLLSNKLVEESMKVTEIREALLKTAYADLSIAYENLEEMSVLKERNRIAREIHDTVGHTLTTVIVELEAGRMLAGKDPEKASEKFIMANKQARKALDELRGSVRLLAKEPEVVSLKQAVLEVLYDTEMHTGITVKSVIEVASEIEPEAAGTIIRIIKEGLSNGIRHGGGTAFFLKLLQQENCVSFLLQDNGKGCSAIKLGFGLDNMKKSIQRLGGQIEFSSEAGEGFEIKILMPL